jgi:hypothetical protein
MKRLLCLVGWHRYEVDDLYFLLCSRCGRRRRRLWIDP